MYTGKVKRTYIYQQHLPSSFTMGVLQNIGNILLTWNEEGFALLCAKEESAKAWFVERKGV